MPIHRICCNLGQGGYGPSASFGFPGHGVRYDGGQPEVRRTMSRLVRWILVGLLLSPVLESRAQTPTGQSASALARGFRLSTELVAGVLVGAFIGWALDKWLGISPWGMIVFLLLGFAAGVINVMRAAGVSGGAGSGPRQGTR